jgi:hypothetical protein
MALTEPVYLSQVSTNNLLQNVTRYVIPEASANIAYSIVSAKRDAFRDASSICKTRVTSVTVMGDPYHRIRRVREVPSQLDVPTSLTPAPRQKLSTCEVHNFLLILPYVCV